MAIPEKTVLYHDKNILDRAIDNVLGQNKPLTASDLNQVVVAAQVQAGIDQYRAAAQSLSINALVNEGHDSTRLGRHLEQSGHKRPPRCHAHALVAGKHTHAAVLRLIMASLKIRIDDPDNGCWLPENTAATPHTSLPRAVPHSRIHRYNYYFWIHSRLSRLENADSFRINLKIIAGHLQQGSHPPYVMLPKDAGITNKGIA